MTPFEFTYCCLEKTFPVHYNKVRRILKKLTKGTKGFQLLDVGGRKSHYTINVNCDVHIVDLPRESELQEQLGLGLTDDIMEQLRRRRSNVKSIKLEDITKTTFEDNTFDGVVSVEVIEHVPDDSAFVYQIHRILKPGGTFVLTTPNGEAREKTYPDHVREYTRVELAIKLGEYFEDVKVFYGVKKGFLHNMGIKGWVSRRPGRILIAPLLMFCVVLANLLELGSSTKAKSTEQLFAIAKK
ncbi:MAG: methyltransferase domain-containing protein [Desulfobacteraceae bacterium]|nr:methyltransferase domain-containing protein [Desulfobacteraceae bacterium]